MTAANVQKTLQEYSLPEKSAFFPRFFKTGPGEYGEGDRFYGVTVPDQRKIASRFKDLPLQEVARLLTHEVHECRLTALFILVLQYEKSRDPAQKQAVINTYLEHIAYVNNWDLVDSSAYKLLGAWLLDKDRQLLYDFAQSGHLWKQRIAIISTLAFIRNRDFADTLAISELLLRHPHDLIHKAVGWMLREVGNRDLATAEQFLEKHHKNMPRTMLRYAIEKMEKEQRRRYMGK